ncbi:hypothetical protein GCM10012275_43000 [Longimycelium tulufanense]|uniref:Uncharacterized protein n=1 Tax=Longimycelium tulufanense TaxID=907463 RepID=A0A8J3CHF0_9PSEU|nr:hypothetical protein [Longimycelium tulufanense]GGM67793.1 hypothetical protein GCM10012275_43000 [Longimycelium tulufanense]
MSEQPWWLPSQEGVDPAIGEDDFDFHRDVLGDALVVGGVAYNPIDWKLEDGDVVRRSPEERAVLLEVDARELAEEDSHRQYAFEIEHEGPDADAPF